MCHKFEVVNEVGLLRGWVQLEISQLFIEDAEMDFKFFQVLVRLSFNPVLKLWQCHHFFIFVQTKGLPVLFFEQVCHLGVLTALGRVGIRRGSRRFRPIFHLDLFSHTFLFSEC